MGWQGYFEDFMRIMSAGNPPLGLQLLVVNTAFLIVVMILRARRRDYRAPGAPNAMPFVFIALNAVVAMQDSAKPLLHLF